MFSDKMILPRDIQARVASNLVEYVNQFESEIFLLFENKIVNLKSIMGVMSLGLCKGTEITIEARGETGHEDLKQVRKYVKEL